MWSYTNAGSGCHSVGEQTLRNIGEWISQAQRHVQPKLFLGQILHVKYYGTCNIHSCVILLHHLTYPIVIKDIRSRSQVFTIDDKRVRKIHEFTIPLCYECYIQLLWAATSFSTNCHSSISYVIYMHG